MPPKKKTSAAAAPSTSLPPPLEQTGGGMDASGRTDVDEEAHDAARSKNKAAQTSAIVHVPRHSQEAQDQQRHGTCSAIRMIGQDQAGGSRGAQDQHARQRAGTSGARSPGWDTAPSNIVRSLSTSRSSRRPPLLPTTPTEVLARAQLLLDYPPTSDKIDEWRATIQSLIGYANGDTPRRPSASPPRQGCRTRAGGNETGGGATTMQSPPRRPRSPTRRIHLDSDSTASSDPRARCDQCQVLHDRQQEDARTRIERRREAQRQSDKRAGTSVNCSTKGRHRQ